MKSLSRYNSKRDFSKTMEPKGKVSKFKSKRLKFVIQHHLARRDHYDLRLEYDGVYVSFAVPKGPSFNTKDKRLAVKVEDHPLSYGNFEGIIPKGEYGGGTVMLFDKGYWKPLKDENIDFDNGPVKFFLNGERVKGGYSLVRFKDDNWLLIKEKDEYVSNSKISKFKTSIKTGRTMDEITNNRSKKNIDLDIEITNSDKIIFKNNKVTKGDIASYYKLVGNRMMSFLDNRLISTIRCPDGYKGEKFFMKHLNSGSKDLGKKKIRNKDDQFSDYYYVKNVNGLLSEVQMNSFEFHIWGSLQNKVRKPDILVFDLDPDEGLSLKKVRDGVRDLKKILDGLGLKSYLKTSGGKGYHIYVPLSMSSWSKSESIAKDISDILVMNFPNKYTTNMRKDKRKGKIFIDYFRNKMGATSVCPYSLRLKSKPTVSCPIFWSELDKIKPDGITLNNINERLKLRNPWYDFFD